MDGKTWNIFLPDPGGSYRLTCPGSGIDNPYRKIGEIVLDSALTHEDVRRFLILHRNYSRSIEIRPAKEN